MFDKNQQTLNIDINMSGEKKLFERRGSKPTKKHARFKEEDPQALSIKDQKVSKSATMETTLKKADSNSNSKSKQPQQEEKESPSKNLLESPPQAKALKSEKTIQQKLKEIKTKKLKKIGDALEYNTGGKGNSSVPTIINSVKFLASVIQNSPKNSIKLDIPETLVCDKKVMYILYIFTNHLGFAEVIQLNNENDADIEGDEGGGNMVTSETLSNKATAQIIEIGNSWHDRNYADLKNIDSKKFKDVNLYPISVFKICPDASANDSESRMLYFSSSVIDALIDKHTQADFLIQRFIVSRGMSPSIIRCELNIQRYPNLDFDKALQEKAMEAIKEQERKDAEIVAAEELREAEEQFQRTGVRVPVKKSVSPSKKAALEKVEEKVDFKKELSFVDAPDLNLKVFKVSSRIYFNGEQLKERVKTLVKNPAYIPGAKDSHLVPQLIHQQGPVIRFDEEFLSFMMQNNNKLKKLFKEKNLTDNERYQKYLRKKNSVDMESSASENEEQQEEFNRLYNPKSQILKSKIFSVFLQKIKVVDDTEKLRKQHIFKIQQMFQEDLNNYQNQMAGQFVTQELYYKRSNVVETNTRGGFKTDHMVTRIKDQDTEGLRSSIQLLLKMARKKDKFVNKLVVDFLREEGGLNRNMFLQIKFSNSDEQFASFSSEIPKPQFSISKKNTDNQGDFILNTKPLSQLFESIVRQEEEKQAIIDKKNIEELKKKRQEENKEKKKLKSELSDGGQSKWNFSDKQLYDIPPPVKSKFSKVDHQQDRFLTVKDNNGRFHEQKCAGQFCNIKQYDIQQDIPELYVGIIIKMQDDIVQKEQHHRISWSFGAKDDQILPDIGSIDYCVPNSLILLDEDIKAIWLEQKQIQNEIDLVHKEGLNSKVIDDIYASYIDSIAGKKYMCTTAETKFKHIPVCYNCYKFYFKLGKQIIGTNGQINVNTLCQISDPIFNKDKDKEQRFNQIIKFMKQQLEGQVKKNAKEIRQKIQSKVNKKGKEPPKKSNYKKNPYSKKETEDKAAQENPQKSPNADFNDTKKGKTLDMKNVFQKATFGKDVADKSAMPSSRTPGTKEVMFEVQSGRSGISDQSSEKPPKREKINNLLDIIFGDNNDVERPVQPTMPSIYERNKKWKSKGPKTDSSDRQTADTRRHNNCKAELFQSPAKYSQKLKSKKPPKKPEAQKQFLMPIRQNRPSKGFLFPSERPPLQGFSPFTQERYSQSVQSLHNPLPQPMPQTASNTQRVPAPIPDHSNLYSYSDQHTLNLVTQTNPTLKSLPKINVEQSSSSPSHSKQLDSDHYSSASKHSQKKSTRPLNQNYYQLQQNNQNQAYQQVQNSHNNSLQNSFQFQQVSQSQINNQSFNPVHEQLMRALEDQGHPISLEDLKGELTQLQCLSPQFNIQRVMEEYLSGKTLSQIAKGQQMLLPNQREILKLRQVQKMKDFQRDKLSQKSVFMKKSFSLPNLAKESKLVNQMYASDKDPNTNKQQNSQLQHHLSNEIRTSIKNEQYDSTNKVNQFFKRVNQDVIESIIGQNSINFNTKAKIAQDTYNSGVPENKWAGYYKAIKLKKLKSKKQNEMRKQAQQFEKNLTSVQKGGMPRSVSVKDIAKPEFESGLPKRIKIIKFQKQINEKAKPQKLKHISLDEQSDVKTKETTEGNLTGSDQPTKQPSSRKKSVPKLQQDQFVSDNVQIEVIKHDDFEVLEEILSESEITEIVMRDPGDANNQKYLSKSKRGGGNIDTVKEEVIEESVNVHDGTSLIKDYYTSSPGREIISEEIIQATSIIYLEQGEQQIMDESSPREVRGNTEYQFQETSQNILPIRQKLIKPFNLTVTKLKDGTFYSSESNKTSHPFGISHRIFEQLR